MMRYPLRSLFVLFLIPFTFCFFQNVIPAIGETIGETYIAPVPDKSKVLPANDGKSDGCDSSRFECVMGGRAVLDRQTGLIWAKDTEILEKPIPWQEAMTFVENVEIGGKRGWRLPTKEELISVLDTSQSRPALPEGHPFSKLNDMDFGGDGNYIYWTSTEEQGDSNSAWMINMSVGRVGDSIKLFDYKIWPVRNSN